MAQIDVKVGEVRQRLALIDDNSVNCIVTSPPYWAQRDYDNRDQIGTESDPQEYIDNMVEVMREARRVLREDGTCWLNIGDTWLDVEAVKEPAKWGDGSKGTSKPRGSFNTKGTPRRDGEGFRYISDTRRKRSVWEVATSRYHGAHFAMFPPDLITPCILAGCPPDGTVLDPFGGSGTTAGVAATQGRNSIIIELNADYVRQVMPDRIKWILERASHPLDEYPNVDYDWGISATLSNTSPDSVR